MFFSTQKVIKKEWLIFLLITTIAYLIIKFSPSLLALSLPDSDSYVHPSAYRAAIYPSFIDFFEFLKINIVDLQILILSLSISSLCMTLFHLIEKTCHIFDFAAIWSSPPKCCRVL